MTPSDYYESIRNKLTDFGHNAVVDVGRILSLMQALKVPEKDLMKAVQHAYISHYQAVKGEDANRARQSWVAASGNSFEDFMRHFINSRLSSEKANRRCTQTTTGVWPDSDIVVLAVEKPRTF